MDKIKKFVNDLTGGDGKVDATDIKNQVGDLGLDDLKNLNFPIDKAEIVEVLKSNGSSSMLIEAIERVPDQTFQSVNDLRSKLPF